MSEPMTESDPYNPSPYPPQCGPAVRGGSLRGRWGYR